MKYFSPEVSSLTRDYKQRSTTPHSTNYLKQKLIRKQSSGGLRVGIITTSHTQPTPSLATARQTELKALRHVLRHCRTPFSYIFASSSLKNISFLSTIENYRFSTNPSLRSSHTRTTNPATHENDDTNGSYDGKPRTTQSLRVAGRRRSSRVWSKLFLEHIYQLKISVSHLN